eukprot:CAMPEP_0117438958 /NCGR_PEP_ID=MMETSP0759-20121206/2323_1 /TAXON_ID=63605 /ORGANISM="Percolomonas cosmopolitus, Strain WS" /LENGTH=86 /DNA_ID=CAMNT_0005230669 /DNA_START=176 /DNA_END=436 /DNA_ORIENTATION=+
MIKSVILFILVTLMISFTEAGPGAGAACYTACNVGYATCMSSSGLTAGASGPVGWWAWLTSAAAACSSVQAACMTACVAAFGAPTP